MEWWMFAVMALAFACEYIDSSLGMGYGTSLTPILMAMGFDPVTQVVPAVLLSEFVTGFSAGIFHHNVENVDFSPKSRDTKLTFFLCLFAVIGALLGKFVLEMMTKQQIKLAIGLIVVFMGVIILATFNRRLKFSWPRMTIVGVLAAINKTISGGGYGPLVTAGQMVSGVGVKNAVGVTSMAEGVTCFVALAAMCIWPAVDSKASPIDWTLAPWLMAGAVLSVPLAAHTLKRVTEKWARFAVAIVVLLLGSYTLYGVIFPKQKKGADTKPAAASVVATQASNGEAIDVNTATYTPATTEPTAK
jgi:uncharacterized membrane protein YfcA